MTFKAKYKCRLCGEEYTDSRILDINLNGLIRNTISLIDGCYFICGNSISIVESHLCKDGNLGIAGLKGFVKDA